VNTENGNSQHLEVSKGI